MQVRRFQCKSMPYTIDFYLCAHWGGVGETRKGADFTGSYSKEISTVMEEIIQIQKLSLYRLDNASHTDFHTTIGGRIAEVGAEKLGIPAALAAEYQQCIQEAIEMIKETRTSRRTKALQQKDAECDRLVSFILAVVRAMRLSPRAEAVESAEDLYLQLRVGKRIQAEGIGVKPARIESLLHDLKKPEHAVHITRLGLDEAVGLLDKVKEEVRALMNERSEERIEKKRPSLTHLRPKTDEVYGRIVQHLQMSHFVGKPPVDREAIAQFASYINERVSQIRMTHKQSQSHRKALRKPKAAPTPTP